MAAPKKYPDELRARAVRLYRGSDPKPVIRRLAEQLGVHHEALRNWIRQDEADRGERTTGPRPASRRSCAGFGGRTRNSSAPTGSSRPRVLFSPRNSTRPGDGREARCAASRPLRGRAHPPGPRHRLLHLLRLGPAPGRPVTAAAAGRGAGGRDRGHPHHLRRYLRQPAGARHPAPPRDPGVAQTGRAADARPRAPLPVTGGPRAEPVEHAAATVRGFDRLGSAGGACAHAGQVVRTHFHSSRWRPVGSARAIRTAGWAPVWFAGAGDFGPGRVVRPPVGRSCAVGRRPRPENESNPSDRNERTIVVLIGRK